MKRFRKIVQRILRDSSRPILAVPAPTIKEWAVPAPPLETNGLGGAGGVAVALPKQPNGFDNKYLQNVEHKPKNKIRVRRS